MMGTCTFSTSPSQIMPRFASERHTRSKSQRTFVFARFVPSSPGWPFAKS